MDLSQSLDASLRSGLSLASNATKDDILSQLDQEMEADDQLSQSLRGRQKSVNSMEAFAASAKAAQQAHEMLHGGSRERVNLAMFPNADFFYKMVAKVEGKYYSIYDASVEYVVGKVHHEPVKEDKKGGYFVYAKL